MKSPVVNAAGWYKVTNSLKEKSRFLKLYKGIGKNIVIEDSNKNILLYTSLTPKSPQLYVKAPKF